ncbi:MAG: hypothetical protein Q7S87_05200 [Agitococcus sp.]|nr:hypothetical protein [Agitococcus sp.]MDO9179186.1 hypothetical protein [Agitococcus sp.]
MLISQNAVHNVKTQGMHISHSFPILSSPHMYNILSSGLYSDKLGAVMREPGCNACDSHVMAGTPQLPIEVKLPTALSPSFYIKDWGVGLTDEEVRQVYTSYGKSTKQAITDVVGAFGLGSKAPFAYTALNSEEAGGFTVVAVKNGIKNIYTCYFDESGIPTAAQTYSGPADEDWPHGVMVTFPVRPADFVSFHQSAVNIFQWFPVQPRVLGLSLPLQPAQFSISTDFFGLGRREGAAVIMGGVRYPLDRTRISGLTPQETCLLDSGIHLFLPIGTVMMTPSREALQYFSDTAQKLRPYFNAAIVWIMQDIRNATAEFGQNQTWRGKREFINALKGYNTAMANTFEAFLKVSVDVAPALLTTAECTGLLRDRIPTVPVPSWVGASTPYSIVRVIASTKGGSCMSIKDGKFIKNKKEYDALLSANTQTHIVFSNSDHIDARIALARNAGLIENILLLKVPSKRHWAEAESYAQKIAMCPELRGIPMLGTAELSLPDAIRQRKEAQKASRTNKSTTIRTRLSSLLMYLPISGRIVELKELSDIQESPTKLYVVSRSTSIERGVFVNKGEDNRTYSVPLNAFTEVWASVQRIAHYLSLPLDGVVVVGSEREAKRLQLSDGGFQPLLAWLETNLEQHRLQLAQLDKNRSCFPAINFGAPLFAPAAYGVLGIVGWLSVHNTAYFEELKERFALSASFTELTQICIKCSEPAQVLQQNRELFSALETLNRVIQGEFTCYTSSRVMYSELSMRAKLALVPTWHLLNIPEIYKVLQSPHPHLAYPLIETALAILDLHRTGSAPLVPS